MPYGGAVSDGGSYDVVVVGNGVLGLSLGVSLARRDLSVAVVGERARPYAASAAAGAMLGCFGEVTSTLLASSHGRRKIDLGVEAQRLWPGWLEALRSDSGRNTDDLVTADGTVVILNTVGVAGIDSANFQAIQSALTTYEQKHEELDADAIAWISPDTAARPLRALFLADEHAVDSAALLVTLEAAFIALGGTLVDDSVTALDHLAGRVRGVALSSGAALSGGEVVLAAGAASQAVVASMPDLAERMPPLISGYGLSALLSAPESPGPRHVVRTPNRAFACGLHLVPRNANEVYVGATNVISTMPVTTPVIRDVQFLLDCAARQLHRDFWTAGVNRIQVGNRPVALDGFPLIGLAVPGLWMLTGTYRDGLHLSPLLAEEMAARIVGDESRVDLSPFAPVRAPIQSASRRDIVETSVTHMVATGYEHDWRVPVEWPRTMEHSLRLEFSRFAEMIHPQFTPPPEILAAARYAPELVMMLRKFYGSGQAAGV
ncbi:FAD-binding oxidoreductase [Actinoplanes sp. N902-109]|uniref:NAD(P)/FAD-dependent oxidoreductase n=1 Tax=Actinoplanes sp. (strain N902-109) TaxID=649831 RepID=UPI0003295718|nr:FAD-dependent oxidoreductase [Actinoplanes sp. N902-109]AGL16376.1 FAD dependent oxidoreductase [Actinoplanes sp. N902-109]